MRCTPLVIFTSNLEKDEDIYNALVADASFTHPNKQVHSSIFIYAKTIHYLLKNKNQPDIAEKSFNLALDLASKKYGNHSYN
jgi:hypothetical protein